MTTNLHRFTVHVRPGANRPGEHIAVVAPNPAKARAHALDHYRRVHHLPTNVQLFAITTKG